MERPGGPAEDEEPFDPLEWTTGLVIGGFQHNSRFPHLYAWEEPARPGHAEGLQCVRPHQGREGPQAGHELLERHACAWPPISRVRRGTRAGSPITLAGR